MGFPSLAAAQAPVITTNPVDVTINAGGTAVFTAAATGGPTPTVQWQFSTDGGATFNNVAGATATTLLVPNVTAGQNGTKFRAVFTNVNGSATTTAATMTVNFPPTVTTNPVSQSIAAGSNVSFTAAASGNPTPTVQWQQSTDGGATFTNIGGATSTTLSFTTTIGQNGNQYRAVFTNTTGSATTTAATLTVTAGPVITTNPVDVTINAGGNAVFTAAATGSPTPTVQWQSSTDGGATFNNVPGATTTTLTVPGVTAGQNGTKFRAVFANASGAATTTAATMTVNFPPTVTTNPTSQSVGAGANVSFTAAASGNPTPTVQWQQSADGGATFTNIGGATSTTLSFTTAAGQNGNQYRAVFTNTTGSATTTAATLTVTSGIATHFSVSAPAAATAGLPFSVTVTALDPANNVAVGYAGTAHFTSSDGAAALPANYTFIAGDNGVHTFSITLNTITSSTVTATDTISATITGTSGAIGVTTSAATHFAISAPASATSGASFNVTVTALDAANHVSPGYSGTVHFTSSDGAAVLPANYTFVAGDNGVHTFTATLNTAGSRTITAADTISAAITGTSGAINVTSSAATHFSVSAPASSTSGTSFNVTVTALDAVNNVAAGYSGTVHFTSSDGAAVLPANYSFVAGDNGVHTFTATLNTAGSRTITATDTISAAITGTSGAINVTSSAATHFSVSAPASTSPGTSFNVTVTALDTANNVAPGYAGTVHFTSSDGAAVLPANATLTNGVKTFSVTLQTLAVQTVTATDTVTPTISGTAAINVVAKSSATTTLVSSLNPSTTSQAVTFTATVTGNAPTGSVTFKDGGSTLGTAALNGSGQATFSTSSLTTGSHSITATYGGDGANLGATSTVLTQTVNTPADSLKLRALQVLVTPMVAQTSGQAISDAVDSAIGEGFGGGGTFMAPSGNGVRFNFAADPDARATDAAPRAGDPFSGANASFADGSHGFGSHPPSSSRIDNAFGALGYAGPAKAPPLRVTEPREWLGWADIRGATLDRWGSSTALPGASVLYGNQVNLLAGLTRKFTPNFLMGVVGGYENFDYRSDALQGRLKGDGWTVGSYLGWKVTPNIRFDTSVSYSGIGYNGSAGLAAGSFDGRRWLVTSGLTGSYGNFGVRIEPSARVYALWEHENAYTDTLGTLQTARDFATGRASGGVKLSYPVPWSGTTVLAPYVGLYGDYYFNSDSAGAPAAAAAAIPSNLVLDGWSARASGGVTASFGQGAQIAVGAERGGIGGNFGLWTYRARASVPFAAH